MKLLAVGHPDKRKELEAILEMEVKLTGIDNPSMIPDNLKNIDLIIDLDFDCRSQIYPGYFNLDGKPVMVSSTRIQLAEIVHNNGEGVYCILMGINSLPSFIERNKLEISYLDEAARAVGKNLMKYFKADFIEVQDRVGMVSPRVIMMIINEACYTLQEGTASVKDIDTGMKLGTNYPFGPFEWADKIGIENVYLTLKSIFEDTGDSRYKISPLLKTKYLKREKFYL